MQTVGELPLDNVVTIGRQSTIGDAFTELMATEATELYVTDDHHHLIGIVPDYELLRAKLSGVADETPVERIMSSQVLCFTTESPVEAVLADFRNGFRSRAAVIENGRLIGQITRSRLLRVMCVPKPSCVPRPKICNSEFARNAWTLLNCTTA